jgi:hypothetical protein
VGEDFEERSPFVDEVDRPRWRLGFVFRPNDPWLVWQVGSFARIDGIDGPVGSTFIAAPAGSISFPRERRG